MTKTAKKYGIIVFSAVLLISFFIFMIHEPGPDGNIKDITFYKLEKIRKIQKKSVIEYFNNVHRLAKNIRNDKVMLGFFDAMKTNKNPHQSDLEYKLDVYYVSKYSDFYDILFVDPAGFIFHSIKKESDYRKNLFEGALAGTKLAERIRTKTDVDLVDYEYYSPSDEPAAFFPVLLEKKGKHIGWFVLQCSIDKVNTTLARNKDMGRTGEVYLVNKEKLMLSDSRFLEDSTILKLKVDTRSVKEALAKGTGRRIIEDYRGIRVFSSFEKFKVFGTTWIIIAEIDEDEVITEYYKKYKTYFQEEMCRYLEHASFPACKRKYSSAEMKRVDMSEFGKTTKNVMLQTKGISTCTGVAIVYPDRFGYLVHIPPTDEIYFPGTFSRLFIKGGKIDFLGELIRRITYYNVHPYEYKNLTFIIVAPHTNSFPKAVDKILEHGIELANVKFLYNPRAVSANVFLHGDDNSLNVEWNYQKGSLLTCASDIKDLGAVLKDIIKYSE